MGEALANVAASQRWMPRYAVRLAVVKNPYAPVPWAVRLATTLRTRDLREVAADASLAPLVREQAADLCGRPTGQWSSPATAAGSGAG